MLGRNKVKTVRYLSNKALLLATFATLPMLAWADASGGLSKTASHGTSVQDLVDSGDTFVTRLGGFVSGFLILFGLILFAISVYKMRDPEKTALGLWGAVLAAAIACASLIFGVVVWLMRSSLGI